jgi:hypothetical protein
LDARRSGEGHWCLECPFCLNVVIPDPIPAVSSALLSHLVLVVEESANRAAPYCPHFPRLDEFHRPHSQQNTRLDSQAAAVHPPLSSLTPPAWYAPTHYYSADSVSDSSSIHLPLSPLPALSAAQESTALSAPATSADS